MNEIQKNPVSQNRTRLKPLLFTTLALTAFAANSVLCRKALGGEAIDAAGFTIIRLLSGVLVLLLISGINGKKPVRKEKGNWFAGMMLFVYAEAFSFAYITLDTGTGALILFGSVQTTMVLLSLLSRNRLRLSEWAGMFIAFAGFVYLVLPQLTTPSLTGFILMSIAGIAWGVYTLNGRKSRNPLSDTTFNFVRTIPFVVLLGVIVLRQMHFSPEGIILAVVSGAIASGIGYSLWYLALGGLTDMQAAVLQLSVPVIAAAGGVIFVTEPVTLRLMLSALLVLGGILIVILGKYFHGKMKLFGR